MVIAASAAFLPVLVFCSRCQHIIAACPVAASALYTPSGLRGQGKGMAQKQGRTRAGADVGGDRFPW